MHLFYPRYHAQSFYRNTFLVDKPQQIARAEKSDREWNNIAESGCHFTCLAMIAGVDPATLADAAIQTGYYAPDKDLPARALDGKRGPLVWDQNVPSKKGRSWVFRQVWHPDRRALVDIEFSCQRWDDHLPLKTATRLAHAAVLEGRHVVSGSFEHSVLIAGLSADGPLVWDPDMARGSGAARRGAGCRPWSPAACPCAPGPSARRCASSPSSSTSCGCASDGGSARTLPGRSVCGSNCPEAPLYQAHKAIIVIAFECAAAMPALRPDAGIQATAAADRHCHRATWCRRGGSSRRCPTTSAGCCPA